MIEPDIRVRGAREHNLRGVDLVLPRGRLIVFTGVSGSGKSSLAFDTLYAEGRRRYVESLSSYARQFLGAQSKPDADAITGLPPTISIRQKTAGDNPRSTIGTITQVHDFLRVLFARLGTQHCPKCGRPIAAQTREQIVARILTLPAGARFAMLAPVIAGRKGEHRDLCDDLLRQGFVRARVNGRVVPLNENLRLDKNLRHHIEVVIDRLVAGPDIRVRLSEAVELGLKLGGGTVIVSTSLNAPTGAGGAGDILLSSSYACADCRRSFEPPSPQLLSFNAPAGMCGTCDGLGECTDFDLEKVLPDPARGIVEGATLLQGGFFGPARRKRLESVAAHIGFALDKPWKDVPPEKQKKLLHGCGEEEVTYHGRVNGQEVRWRGRWNGLIADLRALYKTAPGEIVRGYFEKYMSTRRCPDCRGARVNEQAQAVRLTGRVKDAPAALNIAQLCALPIADARRFVENLELTPLQRTIGAEAVKEVVTRLGFLIDVGLEYLTLDRSAPTLSGGEAQRIRLASQVGCGLTGVLYVLDEPSIGLHARDNARLLSALKALRDAGNTVLVVEHDEETMRAADLIVDFGPGPGVQGGKVVFAGTWDQLLNAEGSVTADYLLGRKRIDVPAIRRGGNRSGTEHDADNRR
jgi:excinuclease ABC subunit A